MASAGKKKRTYFDIPVEEREYVTRQEVEVLFPISARELATRAMEGNGPPYVLRGGRAIYAKSSLTRWLTSQEQIGVEGPRGRGAGR